MQLDGVLRDLVREARKPAEIIYQVGNGAAAPAVPHARPIAKATWGKTFGIRGAMASREVTLWDAQDARRLSISITSGQTAYLPCSAS